MAGAAAAIAHATRNSTASSARQTGRGSIAGLLRGNGNDEVPEVSVPQSMVKQYMERVEIFMGGMKVQVFVAGLIGGNFLTNIIEKQLDPRGEKLTHVFGGFELFYNICFTIELSLNMFAQWPFRFWKSGWNIFDFIVVSIGLLTTFEVPLPGPFAMLRMMRAFRVFRLFKRVKSLNKIIKSLFRAVPGVLNSLFILLLVMSIYSILAVDFFMDYGAGGTFMNEQGIEVSLSTSRGQDYGFEYFGNFGKSIYTMFQVMTGESWSEAVARPMLFGNSFTMAFGGSFYFVSFYLVNAVVLINVVVAVLLGEVVDNGSEEEDAQTPSKNQTTIEILNGMTLAELLTEFAEDTHLGGSLRKWMQTAEYIVGKGNRGSEISMSPNSCVWSSEDSALPAAGEVAALSADVATLKAEMKAILEPLQSIAQAYQCYQGEPAHVPSKAPWKEGDRGTGDDRASTPPTCPPLLHSQAPPVKSSVPRVCEECPEDTSNNHSSLPMQPDDQVS